MSAARRYRLQLTAVYGFSATLRSYLYMYEREGGGSGCKHAHTRAHAYGITPAN